MAIWSSWTILNPNNKKEIPAEAGDAIADPWLVLRGFLLTTSEYATVEFLTPPISGRLERGVVIPDHNFPGANGLPGNFNMYAYQEYSERDDFTGAVADTLDILNAQGVAILNNGLVHLHTLTLPGTRNPILPQVLVQDRLLLRATGWSAGDVEKRVYVYLYFTTFSANIV